MSVRRVMGIETEYGISVPGDPTANPMLLSGAVVNAYARKLGLRAAQSRWDYEDEAPLRDARGWDMSRMVAHPTQLTDEIDPTSANVVLHNGARLYVDHAHPEYSSPEVTTPRDAVTWDRAGELVMRDCVNELANEGLNVNLYKNNTDGKGVSYGTHENYLMKRTTPFAQIVRQLTPFFVVRQIICGSGKVGIGTESRVPGYQLTQRADFFEAEVGLETTLKRPIINTRDEPHADPERYRRLHVILGDANHADVANLLKMGMTSLVLGMIEDDAVTESFVLREPVQAMRDISHDVTLRRQVDLADGRSMRGIDILEGYLQMAHAWVDRRSGGEPDEPTSQVLALWSQVLDRLRRDPRECARQLDWVAKLQMLEGFRERGGLAWDDPKLRAIDIQWSDVRADKGVFNKLAAGGRFDQVVDADTVAGAVTEPPADTRAYFRGRCVRDFGDELAAASWDSVVFDTSTKRTLRRVPMPEPLRGTREHVGALMDSAANADALLARLAGA